MVQDGKRIECHEHGEGEPTYACQHFAAGTALMYFAAAEADTQWPDAWCEKCEIERIADGGEWTDESMAFASIRLLCHRCYEKRRAAIREGRGHEGDVLFAMPYRCRTCERDHSGLPTWAADAPLPYCELTDEEKARSRLDPDFCEVEDHRFVRTVIEIPILGARERFIWGVWSSLSRTNYDLVRERWDDPGLANAQPMFSWLSTRLPEGLYPSTFALKSQLIFRSGGIRPLVVLEPTDHPLSVEQQAGMSPGRARDLAAFLIPGEARVGS